MAQWAIVDAARMRDEKALRQSDEYARPAASRADI
jgi:hypothetical protein